MKRLLKWAWVPLIIALFVVFSLAPGEAQKAANFWKRVGNILSPRISGDIIDTSNQYASDGSPLVRSTDQIGNVFYGPVDITASASLSATITAIGATAGDLSLAQTSQVGGGLTIPATLQLKAPKGATITVANGTTFTCNGPFDAGNYQVFTGSGTVTFGAGVVASVLPQWWSGPTATAAALNAAWQSLPATGGTVDCRGYQGAQTLTAKVGPVTTPNISFLFGPATYTLSGVAAAQNPWGYQFDFRAGNIWVLGDKSAMPKFITADGTQSGQFSWINLGAGSGGGIRYCELDGNKAGNSAQIDDSFQSGVFLVNDSGSGNTADSRATVESCLVHDFIHYGIQTYGDKTGGNFFEDNFIYNNGKAGDALSTGCGIWLSRGTSNNTVRGNHSYGNKAHGITANSAGVDQHNNKILGNYCYSNGGYGIYSIEEAILGSIAGHGQYDLLVSKNHCYSNTLDGIRVNANGSDLTGYQIFYPTISENHCYSNGGNGVIIMGAAAYGSLIHNVCRNNTGSGIILGLNFDFAYFGNISLNNTTDAIDFASSTQPLAFGNKVNAASTPAIITQIGNVGIGTTSPDSKLHLSSSATTSDVVAQFFASGMANSNYIDLYLGKSRGTDLAGTISFVPQAVAANSYLLFGLYGTTGPLIVGKNNVGIGTVTPQSLLNVKGTGLTVRLDGSNDTGAIYEQFRTSAGSATGYVGVEGNTGGATFAGTLPYATFLASGASGAALQFGTVGVARMLIGSSGNVGVGTTSPIFKHDVNGGVYSRLRRGQLLFNNAVIGTQLALIAETVTNGLFTLGGTGYLAANVTVQANGLQVVTSALDDDSANVLVNNPVLNLSQNPVVSFRFKLDNVTNACSFVGLTTAAFVNKTTLPNDCALIGIDADNVHGFGTNRLILVTRNNGAAAVIDDLGVNMTSGTGVWAVLNTTDPDQPRVWINGTEVSAASILGTIKDATDFYLYAHNQNLAAGAHTMTWVCDQWQNDQPY
jgi:hypothetical protein